MLHPRDDAEPPDAATSARRVFVTRGSYTGALTSYVEASSGLAAADLICQLRAKAAGLGGTWKAWLSSSTTDAVERITSLGPWQTLDGQRAFADRSQLFGEPLVPLEIDEHGAKVDPYTNLGGYVWTGTRAGGRRHEHTCADWTSTLATGHYGRRAASFSWTDEASTSCTQEYRLVCLEI